MKSRNPLSTRHHFIAIVLSIALLAAGMPEHLMAQAAAETPVADTTHINGTHVAIVLGGLAATIAAIHIYQTQGWWKDNRAPFHFQEDLKYGLNVDKFGHFYGGVTSGFIFKKCFIWSNVPETQALWWGAGAALLFQTYTEVEDGFSTWGFDRVDFASDVAGAAYPVIQHYWPPLRSLNMKFSYHKSPLINEPGGSGFKGQKHIMFDDYEGQTIWFSFDMHSILPKPVDAYWPDWLCLAMGYGARDIATSQPYRVYFLALDFDVTRIIPQNTSFLRTLSEAINFIHLPAPAVRVSPGTIWYGFYF
jgi:hypothetical protein